MIHKISIIGAGNVGFSCASSIVHKELGKVILYDIDEGSAIGKAMDINQASPFFYSDSKVYGTGDGNDLKGSEIVIITAGKPRTPGLHRTDLLKENLPIFNQIANIIQNTCPDAILIVVSNPVDSLTYFLQKKLNFPHNRVIGLGCALDSVRFRYFIAERTHASVHSVQALVIGSHDRNMIPLVDYANVGGVPVSFLLKKEILEKICNDVREAGTKIVQHLRTRGSHYAAGVAVSEIVQSIIKDKKIIVPVSTYYNYEQDGYAFKDVYLALPSIIGKNANEGIINLTYSKFILERLKQSYEGVRKVNENISEYL